MNFPKIPYVSSMKDSTAWIRTSVTIVTFLIAFVAFWSSIEHRLTVNSEGITSAKEKLDYHTSENDKERTELLRRLDSMDRKLDDVRLSVAGLKGN